MKIGFLITYFYPKTGGAENNCYYLAKELAKKHEVHVFCSGEEDKDEVIDKINVHRSKEIFRIRYYLGYYPSIIKNILSYDLDILHVHGLGFPQHDRAVSKLKKIKPETKIVCTPHGPFMALKGYNLLAHLFKKLYTPFIVKSLKKYDRIIQVNPWQKEWMKQEYGISKNKIVFIPNGIDKNAFEKSNVNILIKLGNKYDLGKKIVISYLGRIQQYKGIDQIIEALVLLKKDYPNIKFLAIGKDAGDRVRLEKLAKAGGVERDITFTGEVSEEEKYALLDLSEIFIFPSEWEAFGIAALEAMAKGNVIISTKTEGGRFLIKEGKNGFLFDFGNFNELAENIKKTFLDPKIKAKIQKNNIKKAKRFLWNNIAKQLEKEYRKVLKE